MALSSSSEATDEAMSTRDKTKRVAIVGGGAAGLAAARAFLRANEDADAKKPSSPSFDVTVLEKGPCIGGVWRYDLPSSTSGGDSSSSSNSAAKQKDRPMYRNLRTNLPRELMAFRERPWGGDGTSPSYVSHRDVAEYLDGYADEFGLMDSIRFGCEVTGLMVEEKGGENVSGDEEKKDGKVDDANGIDASSLPESWPPIRLEYKSPSSDPISEVYDAVVICNGHYATPSSPTIPGMSQHFHGRTIHAVEYDDPTAFAGKTVLCIGARASGSDVAREVSGYAKKVYLSDSTCGGMKRKGNVSWVPRTTRVDESGSFHFSPPDGTGASEVVVNDVDIVVFCSGYDYDFPFLSAIMDDDDSDSSTKGSARRKTNLNLSFTRGERCVSPLYEQVWHAEHPSVAFLGIPHSVVPFPLFELQAEAVAAQYLPSNSNNRSSTSRSSPIVLPSLKRRMEAADEDASAGGPNSPGRLQDTHFLGSYQWDYCRKMAEMGGVYDEEMEDFIATNKAIYDSAGGERKGLFPGGPDTYRESKYRRDEENRSFRLLESHITKTTDDAVL